MLQLFLCENMQAFQPPKVQTVVCYDCVRSKMASIQRAIQDSEESNARVNLWLEEAASPAGTATDSDRSESVVMSPG